jgi:hypothetical protein
MRRRTSAQSRTGRVLSLQRGRGPAITQQQIRHGCGRLASLRVTVAVIAGDRVLHPEARNRPHDWADTREPVTRCERSVVVAPQASMSGSEPATSNGRGLFLFGRREQAVAKSAAGGRAAGRSSWRRAQLWAAPAATPSRNGRAASIRRRCSPEAMLAWYAERLPTVRINNTFYQMPKVAVLEHWAQATPEAFRFAIKALAAHHARRAAQGRRGGRLGRLPVQEPGDARRQARAGAVPAAAVPEEGPAAPEATSCSCCPRPPRRFEFRHDSWFDDDVYARCRAPARRCACRSARTTRRRRWWRRARGATAAALENYSDADLAQWSSGSRRRSGRRRTCTSCTSRPAPGYAASLLRPGRGREAGQCRRPEKSRMCTTHEISLGRHLLPPDSRGA